MKREITAKVRCPACGALLGFPERVREGDCPECFAVVQRPGAQGRKRNPDSSQGRRRNPESPRELYEHFHEAEPHERTVNVATPSGPLMKIGRLVEIVYEPESPSRKKGTQYEHLFGDAGSSVDRALSHKPILATDGRDIFIVRDKSRYHFKGEGGYTGIIS